MLFGQVMLGACVSLTVTVNEHDGPAVVPQLTVVMPTGKFEPDAGEQLIVPHVPPGVGAKVTTAPHWFGSFEREMLSGQVIVHGGGMVK